jgi:RHS repeat-associated protein
MRRADARAASVRAPHRGRVSSVPRGLPIRHSLPLAGDWDGDGVDSIGLYDVKTGTFRLWNGDPVGAPDYQFTFGPGGSNLLPIAGDWDGDGITTVGLYDQKTGRVALTNSNTAPSKDLDFVFQTPAGPKGLPVVGDWTGKGYDSVGVYDPADSVFYLRDKNADGKPDHGISFGVKASQAIPLAGDWDGDGFTSLGLFNPKTGALYLRDTMVSGPPEVLDTLPPLGSDGEAFVGRFNGVKHAPGGKSAASIGEGGSAVSSLELAVRRQEVRSPEVQKPGEEGFHLFPELGGQDAEDGSGFALAAFQPGSGSGASPAAYPLPPVGSRRPSGLRAQSTPAGLAPNYTWYYTIRDEANRPSIQYHVDANGNVVPDRFFVYLGNLLAASFEYGPGTWLYYTEDHLGSIRMVTNGAGQDICEKRYYPYGYEIVDFCQAPAAGGVPLKFAGMERDASSGIDYDHARYMASLGGRFLSVDLHAGNPRDPQSWNRYGYTRGNPLKRFDPDGLEDRAFYDMERAGGTWSKAQEGADTPETERIRLLALGPMAFAFTVPVAVTALMEAGLLTAPEAFGAIVNSAASGVVGAFSEPDRPTRAFFVGAGVGLVIGPINAPGRIGGAVKTYLASLLSQALTTGSVDQNKAVGAGLAGYTAADIIARLGGAAKLSPAERALILQTIKAYLLYLKTHQQRSPTTPCQAGSPSDGSSSAPCSK